MMGWTYGWDGRQKTYRLLVGETSLKVATWSRPIKTGFKKTGYDDGKWRELDVITRGKLWFLLCGTFSFYYQNIISVFI
jgi:hypothetical protein